MPANQFALRAGLAALAMGCALAAGGCATVQQLLGKPHGEPGVFVGGRSADSLSDAEIDRRLAFISERLDAGELHAKAWQYGWTAVNAGGTALGTAFAVGDSGNDRNFDIIEAAKGLTGTVYLFVDPMPGRHGADPLRDMPSATRGDKLAQLEHGEDMLRAGAHRADQRTGWLLHLGNVGFNAMGAIALLALNDAGHAAISFFVDTAVGEAQIWSQPWQPKDDWQEYQQLAATGMAPAAAPVSWRIVPFQRGLALAVAF